MNDTREHQDSASCRLGKEKYNPPCNKGDQDNAFNHDTTTYSFNVRNKAVSILSKVFLMF
jgi:hypothetical protein